LINHGIALARLGRKEQGRFTFQNAIAVAHDTVALNKAGIAALTLIEEIDDLPPDVLATAYEKANEWLANCYSQNLLLRFKAVGMKLARELRRERQPDTDLLFNKTPSLPDATVQLEAKMISEALANANGQITKAAAQLGMRYQSLAFIIETRHPDLLSQRTPIHRRRRRKHTRK
jgi:hypothetical protein